MGGILEIESSHRKSSRIAGIMPRMMVTCHITGQVRVIRLSLVVALDEGFTEIRIRTKVERRLEFPILDGQISTVGGQETGNGSGGLLVRVLEDRHKGSVRTTGW